VCSWVMRGLEFEYKYSFLTDLNTRGGEGGVSEVIVRVLSEFVERERGEKLMYCQG